MLVSTLALPVGPLTPAWYVFTPIAAVDKVTENKKLTAKLRSKGFILFFLYYRPINAT
jgi:hypothetical protein